MVAARSRVFERRTRRLLSMVATAHRRPAGRVRQVFETSAERQGA
jgi:hypothetical protein